MYTLIQIKWLALAFLPFSGHEGFLYINVKIRLRFYIKLVRTETNCFPLPSAVLHKTVSVHRMDPFTFLAIVFSCFLFETRTHLSQTHLFISVVLVRRVYDVLRLALEFCTEIRGPQCWTKNKKRKRIKEVKGVHAINPYPTAFPYGNGMVLHFYQQQESSTTKTVHRVINKGLKTYV